MARQRIHISNLRIRLPHTDGTTGDLNAIAKSVGREVMRGVAKSAGGRTGVYRIDEISLGRIASSGGLGKIQERVAAKIGTETAKIMGDGAN